MRKTDQEPWSRLEQLEDKAHGAFAGGMLLDMEAGALSKEPQALPKVDFGTIDTVLVSLGLCRLTPPKARTIEEKKKQIVSLLQTSSQVAGIAARNFEALPDEAVDSIYEELMELQQKASQQG